MTEAPLPVAAETRRRAPRYEIEAPVRFWTIGGEADEGTTVNVGRLGMLVRTPGPPLPVDTFIQLRMVLNPGRGWSGPCVACAGRVVRAGCAPSGEGVMAITIDEFALRPAGSEEDSRPPPPVRPRTSSPGEGRGTHDEHQQ